MGGRYPQIMQALALLLCDWLKVKKSNILGPQKCVQKLKKYAYEVERSNQASGTRIVTRKESAKAFVYRA